jgi:hypothetical protein
MLRALTANNAGVLIVCFQISAARSAVEVCTAILVRIFCRSSPFAFMKSRTRLSTAFDKILTCVSFRFTLRPQDGNVCRERVKAPAAEYEGSCDSLICIEPALC